MDNNNTDELNKQEIGNRIRLLREGLKLSQERFAEEARIENMKAISKLENGVQTLSLAQAAGIAKSCGVSVDWIIWGKNSNTDGEVKGKLLQEIEKMKHLLNSL